MIRQMLEQFAADCVAKTWRGEPLTDDEFEAFSAYLQAKEMAGHRWLGDLASEDGSLDTVTGRCGLPLAKVPAWRTAECT